MALGIRGPVSPYFFPEDEEGPIEKPGRRPGLQRFIELRLRLEAEPPELVSDIDVYISTVPAVTALARASAPGSAAAHHLLHKSQHLLH